MTDMTKDGILSLVMILLVMAELLTGLSNNFIHFLFFMAVLTGINQTYED